MEVGSAGGAHQLVLAQQAAEALVDGQRFRDLLGNQGAEARHLSVQLTHARQAVVAVAVHGGGAVRARPWRLRGACHQHCWRWHPSESAKGTAQEAAPGLEQAGNDGGARRVRQSRCGEGA